ncbi:hypothetical protein CR513_43668, partial [Mucuna pruriens]
MSCGKAKSPTYHISMIIFENLIPNQIKESSWDTLKCLKHIKTLTVEEFIHVNFNESKPEKELLELDDSFTGLDLDMPQRPLNEAPLVDDKKEGNLELVTKN